MPTFRFRVPPHLALAPCLLGVAIIAVAGETPETLKLQADNHKATVTRGGMTLVFDRTGNGLMSSARLGGTEVVTQSESGGLFATLIVPRGTPRPLGPIAGDEIQGRARVESVEGRKVGDRAEIRIKGKLAYPIFGDAPFTVDIAVPPKGPAMAVSAELKLPDAARKAWLASFGLAMPLEPDFHPTSKAQPAFDANRSAVAILPRVGTPIPEIRRLVASQDDTSTWGQMLWTLAGVRQLAPTACEVWEAWSTENPMFVLQCHRVHPGWMAVADGRAAIAAAMPGIEKIAPKEIYVDAKEKVLRICFQSPYCRPVEVGPLGTTFRAGPAYVFIEPAQANTRTAEDYADAKKRPALATIGEQIRELPATQCNFGVTPTEVSRGAAKPKKASFPLPLDSELASHDPFPRDRIPIWIDPIQGSQCAFPVTRGIPLGRGVLRDEKQVSLVNELGKTVPCVARAVAFWPDRSIKWLLVDFQPRLFAKLRSHFTLIVGEQAQPAPIATALAVSETADGIERRHGQTPGRHQQAGRDAHGQLRPRSE